MIKQSKIWGTTTEIFRNGIVELHRIQIKPGGYCSEHTHKYKYNMFIVETGRLKVTTWKASDIKDVTEIGPQEQTVVPPGEKHLFEALSCTVAYELYWVELQGEDIERMTVGGISTI